MERIPLNLHKFEANEMRVDRTPPAVLAAGTAPVPVLSRPDSPFADGTAATNSSFTGRTTSRERRQS
jgi:hypothetical protein